jgi:phospho-N-acetylmuramoyl-pentapeptide-transferase
MLYWLAEFSTSFGLLNVFRYITFRTGGATATALFFVFFFGPRIISALRLKQGKGQPIRLDGPQSHLLTKQGTPTMGGLMILSGLFVATLFWARLDNYFVWLVLFVMLGFGAIGFYDDYLKITRHTHKGFSGRLRLALEAAIAVLACYAMMHLGTPLTSALGFPAIKGFVVNLGWLFLIFGPFVIVASGNAVNLTDGLDGLAIVPVMIAVGTFGIIAYLVGNAIFANYLEINFVPGTGELAVVAGAVIGAGLGFL